MLKRDWIRSEAGEGVCTSLSRCVRDIFKAWFVLPLSHIHSASPLESVMNCAVGGCRLRLC